MKMMILSTIDTILGLRPQSNHRFVTQIQGWTNCLIFYIFVSSLIPRKVHVSSFNHSYHFQPLASFPWVWSAFLSFLVSLFSFPTGIHFLIFLRYLKSECAYTGSFHQHNNNLTFHINHLISVSKFNFFINLSSLLIWLFDSIYIEYIHYTISACKQHVSLFQNVQLHPIYKLNHPFLKHLCLLDIHAHFQ